MKQWDKNLRGAIALCFGSNILCFMDRVNISIAAPVMAQELGWDETRMGFVF